MTQTNQTKSYLQEHGLDADVFFTGADGPITPQMRESWIAEHEDAISHPNIEYDNTFGTYDYAFTLPEDKAAWARENPTEAKELYSPDRSSRLVFYDDEIILHGTVQDPGLAVVEALVIETTLGTTEQHD